MFMQLASCGRACRSDTAALGSDAGQRGGSPNRQWSGFAKRVTDGIRNGCAVSASLELLLDRSNTLAVDACDGDGHEVSSHAANRITQAIDKSTPMTYSPGMTRTYDPFRPSHLNRAQAENVRFYDALGRIVVDGIERLMNDALEAKRDGYRFEDTEKRETP